MKPLTRQQLWRQAHPDRYRAHLAVETAKRRGLLKPGPCTVCGAARAEAHHPDYRSPLKVVWLCRRHHRLIHARGDA